MLSPVLFSSASCEWATPADFFNRLDTEFHFTVDVCASRDNAKVAKFYDIESDGLKQSWSGETWWCNPPYGRTIGQWTSKAALSSLDSTGAMLLPARTDTKWFHEDILPVATEIRFVKGRLTFGGISAPAPFPSMVVIYKPKEVFPRLRSMSGK